MQHYLVQQIISVMEPLLLEKTIVFCWVPSHTGIRGNEMADEAARKGLELDVMPILVPSSDYKQYISGYMMDCWQTEWSTLVDNKLHKIKPTVGEWPQCPSNLSRTQEIVLSRVRIGHTRLTHSYLMACENKPMCDTCNSVLSVEHILSDCAKYSTERVSCFNGCDTISKIFTECSALDILSFLRATKLLDKI